MKFQAERINPELMEWSFTMQQLFKLYVHVRPKARNKIVLDAACGEGYGTYALAQVARKIVGIDLAEDAIRNAVDHFKVKNMTFLAMDGTAMKFSNASFDLVCSAHTLEHIPNYDEFLKEIHRVLKPGGVLYLSTPNHDTMIAGVNPFHFKEFKPEEFRTAILARFPKTKFYGLFGNEKYMRARLAANRYGRFIIAFDPFSLRKLVPRWLKLYLYNAANLFIYRRVRKKVPLADKVTTKDLILKLGKLEGCVDFIAVCQK